MKQKKIVKIINIVLIVIFVVSAFNIGKIYYDYGKADSTYQEIQKEYLADKPRTPTNNETQQTEITEPSITVDFDSLLKRNKDIIGWLYCPDTLINYPVVKGKDNDQYLHRNLDGKHLVSGTLFADYRNGNLHNDANYIIYGHNMKNGAMFGTLTNYKEQTYYDKHPVIYYLTPEGNYKIELFAGLVVKRDDKIYSLNDSREEFFEMIKEFRTKSTFASAVEPKLDDTFITLSTCSYEFDNARYIVIGKLTVEE